MYRLHIIFTSREKQKSDYDWADIVVDDIAVGKARCLISGVELTICSINIYPEFQGHGYGKEFVERAKLIYKIIKADRVRFNAIGFWETLGFIKDSDSSNWIYTRGNREKE